jgi:hypothetical protein
MGPYDSDSEADTWLLGWGGARYERMISIGVIDEAESTCVEKKD